MKILHSFSAKITQETFVTSYSNGDRQCCAFVEDGETLTINFGTDCLQKLAETIHILQEIHQYLSKQRQQQITQELERLNSHNSIHSSNGNGKHHESREIAF
ncbi:MAG: hypothetical protein KME52_19420 [Desmonostoc geniculatum HA4340-LM1]|jgi:hypothetical protein|nr:hypothetical protein [Desmonostoc geniculatum HA4340-LM1]